MIDAHLSTPEDEELVHRLLEFHNHHFGPIVRYQPGRARPEMGSHAEVFAGVSDAREFGGTRFTPYNSCGRGFSILQACIPALAEALERYASALPVRGARIDSASFHEMVRHHRLLELDEYQLFRPEQALSEGVRLLTADLKTSWVRGRDMTDAGTEIWFPLDMLHMHGANLGVGSSNGFALGTSPAHASFRAACEILERDCFLDMWWRRRPVGAARLSDYADEIEPLQRRQSSLLVENSLVFDCSEKWQVPCYFVLAHSGDKHPHFVILGGCDFDAQAAFKSALMETFRSWSSIEKHVFEHDVELPAEPFERSIQNFEDIKHYLLTPAARNATRFLFEAPLFPRDQIKALASLGGSAPYESKLRDLTERIRARGSRLLLFDFTPEDLASKGFYLSRAFVTNTIPLNSSHARRPWGCPALRDVPVAELNPWPHVFI